MKPQTLETGKPMSSPRKIFFLLDQESSHISLPTAFQFTFYSL